ncbi:hybrid sensor histidine kinase/response regulator [Azospirillum soli]|uniref:hybrid sensor histidine kinase/response regulator n=1 Tax=Azospirillum soli TaxID=1304799 RepID=UPI001AE86EBD|nr:ATP-binding protein [Azospirillum soli]MBP2314275.1 PAS domain S-box-containing protein [Azospirillum soli]
MAEPCSPAPTADALLHCLEGLDLGIVILDGGRRIVHWNSWMSRHSGIPRRLAIGSELCELFPEAQGGRLAGAVREAIDTGLSAVLSHHVNASLLPLMRADNQGEELVAQSIIVRPVKIGAGCGCLIQIHDQTYAVERERKLRVQRNARYHAIVEAAQDCFVTVDEGGLIQGMNPISEVRFGLAQDAALGLPIGTLLPGLEDPGRLGAPLVEMRAVGAEGREFDAEITTGSWIGGGLRYYTLFIRDVTERNQAVEELRRSQRMQALGQLTGGIAHEFNNLLMVMRANAELLQDTGTGPNADHIRSLAAEIVRAADRGRNLTDGLLSFARRQPLRPEPVQLRTMIAETVRMAIPSLGADIDVQVECASGDPRVLADRAQLQNALLNLLINARDAMPNGGRVLVRAQSGPEGFCTLTVADTGVGMTPDVLDRACEPFFTTKGPGRGTGLGLSMVNGFARQSGGAFELDSMPGAGTRASLRLPCSPVEEEPSAAEAVAPDPIASDPIASNSGHAAALLARFPPLRILVAEDDPQVREVVVTMLGSGGHRITAVEDAMAALEFLIDDEADLLLADVMLPHGMSGVVLSREARRLQPRLAVVLMSGYNELAPGQADLAGPAEILRKPFTRRDLDHHMLAALEQVGRR